MPDKTSQNRRRWQIALVSIFTLAVLALMYYLRSVFNPLLLALVLAYILNPLVAWLESKKIPRKGAVALVFCGLAAIILIGCLAIVPGVVKQASTWYIPLVGEHYQDLNKNNVYDTEPKPEPFTDANENGKRDPGYISILREKLLKDHPEEKPDAENNEEKETENATTAAASGKPAVAEEPTSPSITERIEQIIPLEKRKEFYKLALSKLNDNISAIASRSGELAAETIKGGAAAAGALWSIALFAVLTPIYMLFLLYGMNDGWNKFITLVPGKIRPRFLDIIKKIDIVIGAFFRGRLLVCSSIGLVTAVGFAICRVPLGVTLGLIIGVASFIPFLSNIPLAFALLLCWLDGMSLGGFAAVICVFAAGQAVDPLLMTVVMGKELQLHPITILLSMFVCASLFGFFGMLLAVPIVAVAKILFREFVYPHLRELAEEDAAETV